MRKDLVTSLRLVLASVLLCAVLYPLALLGIARAAVPGRALGSLVRNASGTVIGSRLIAQGFTRPSYLWPRPSAVGYDAAASGGSNLAASNPALRARAEATTRHLGATASRPAPGDLVAASGSGLDPDITLAAALYQAKRIASARGVDPARVEGVLRREASAPMPFRAPLVNVLEANLALDRDLGPPPAP